LLRHGAAPAKPRDVERLVPQLRHHVRHRNRDIGDAIRIKPVGRAAQTRHVDSDTRAAGNPTQQRAGQPVVGGNAVEEQQRRRFMALVITPE
jgi:hypothetical protein